MSQPFVLIRGQSEDHSSSFLLRTANAVPAAIASIANAIPTPASPVLGAEVFVPAFAAVVVVVAAVVVVVAVLVVVVAVVVVVVTAKSSITMMLPSVSS